MITLLEQMGAVVPVVVFRKPRPLQPNVTAHLVLLADYAELAIKTERDPEQCRQWATKARICAERLEAMLATPIPTPEGEHNAE